jgi:aryl-alcohol dehydrogenase-like predicted oxidoreductase
MAAAGRVPQPASDPREAPLVELRTLGGTGIRVSVHCLGAMMFGKAGNRDEAECVGMVHRALDAGINFIDTADRYSLGQSEEIVGRALAGRRDEVVLATKFHGPMPGGSRDDDPNRQGASRRWIVQAVEDSLRRLQTDYIDVYQQHRPDPRVDPEETLSALTDLVRQGKIRAIGTSSFPAELITEMQWISQRRGLERVRCEQPPYSLFTRGIEKAVLPTCRRHGMGVIVWSPLNGGWLTGKYRMGQEPPAGSRAARGWTTTRWDPDRPGPRRKYELVEEVAKVAADVGVPMSHLAHAWVLEHPAVTAAIIGPRTPDQLEEALAGADLRLDPDVLDRLDALVPPGTDIEPDDLFAVLPGLDVAARRRPR